MTTMATRVDAVDTRGDEPFLRLTWTDPMTGAHGYLVVHTLVGDLATGGTRMRAGCTMSEVEDLARGMAAKTAVFDLPVGGAKGGIDFDPKDPRAVDVLQRFCQAMRPWLNAHWVTAEDLGVPQHLLDEVFERLGLHQSFHAAISRAADPAITLDRVRTSLNAPVDGGFLLGDVIGGYGVAQACIATANAYRWAPAETTVAIQGIGTMGGGAAWYLHEAGMRVTAVADAAGTLYCADGLDIPSLLDLRDEYGEVDRSRVPSHVEQLPRDAVLGIPADIFVPAAISYAITAENVGRVAGRVVIEAGAVVTNSTIRGPVTIGADAVIANSYVGPFTSIGERVRVVESEVEGSVLLEDSSLLGVPRLIDSLLGRGAEVTRSDRAPRANRLLVGDHSTVELHT